jgi:hypothetical protein
VRDELDARIRALEAERGRPDAQPQTVAELMQRLIGTLHALWITPPDPVDNSVPRTRDNRKDE